MKIYLTVKEVNIIRKSLKTLFPFQKYNIKGASNKDFVNILNKLNKRLNEELEK